MASEEPKSDKHWVSIDKPKQVVKLSKKAALVRNKGPAQEQITAEQLLREAKERELEVIPPAPKQKISDPEELKQFQYKKRKEYEDGIRKNRMQIANWIKYAKWEESIGEIQRSRSIFERALDVEHRNIGLWLQYAEMEMRNRQVNHARNIWDRAVTLLPRATQFWLKFAYLEEVVGNIPGARQIFERWMEWEPDEQAWQTYINFELRFKEIDKARQIWQRFLHVHHEEVNWIKYARFEERNGNIIGARQVFEQACDFYGDFNINEKLLVAFAKFEERQKEHDRARAIYKFALNHLPKERTEEIYKQYTIHEKKYGEKGEIEDVIVSKRKHQYEEKIAANAYNYDAWFDYCRLMESENQDPEEVREVYERAIGNVPPDEEKRSWRRYIYLWINYALYEELKMKDYEKTREVYTACLDLIPHKSFTFSKIWIMFAHFEIRQRNLAKARKILGVAIGKCPKEKLFKGYIDLELQLREFDRCRILYEQFLKFQPENCATWIRFAELETLLGDAERARAIYELAITQPQLDMPEILWKSYIDFEVGQEEWDLGRKLYRRLLQRTRHVKVWLSYAQFEMATDADFKERIEGSRQIFRKANNAMRESENREERLLLLERWKQFEDENGTEADKKTVEKEMPRRVKKRRPIIGEDGVTETGWEEYYDYIFPSDEAAQGTLKLLDLAKKWKKKQDTVPEPPSTQQDSTEKEMESHPEKEGLATEGEPEEAGLSENEENVKKPDKEREGDTDTDISSTSSESSSSDEE